MNKKLIIQFYDILLNRVPNDKEISEWIKLDLSISELLSSILESKEYATNKNLTRKEDFDVLLEKYTGCSKADIITLQEYHFKRDSKPGYILDFLGTYTSVDYFNSYDKLSGLVEGIPLISNFHAEVIEYVGLIKSINRCKGRFNAIELGAGWCPWLVASHMCATRKGLEIGMMVGIEADSDHVDYGKRHFESNDISMSNIILKEGIISVSNEPMYFPVIDSNIDWGAKAVTAKDYDKIKYKKSFLKKDSYTIKDIVGLFSEDIDLCHIDIQGHEFDIVQNGIEHLNKSVKFMIIGTHSRKIEFELMELLYSEKWILENEKPCKSATGKYSNLLLDGTQLWLNPNLKD